MYDYEIQNSFVESSRLANATSGRSVEDSQYNFAGSNVPRYSNPSSTFDSNRSTYSSVGIHLACGPDELHAHGNCGPLPADNLKYACSLHSADAMSEPFFSRSQQLSKLESMKARSFIEEVQSTVTGIPISQSNFAFDGMGAYPSIKTSNVMHNSGSYPSMNTSNGMHNSGLCFGSSQDSYPTSRSFTENQNQNQKSSFGIQQSTGGMKCTTEEMIQRAADYLAVTSCDPSQGQEMSYEAKCRTSLSDHQQGIMESSVRSSLGTACHDPIDEAVDVKRGFWHATSSLDNSLMGQGTFSSSTKRLSRTDSHEKLSNISSERVNEANQFYCKGRRWGGENRYTIPCSDFSHTWLKIR